MNRPKVKAVTPLPAGIAQQIIQADQQLLELQRQIEKGRLVRENLILSAALELGLNKAELSTLQLCREDSSEGGSSLSFRVPPPQTYKEPAAAPAKPSP